MYLRPYRTSDLPALYLLDKVCFEPPFRFSRETMRRFAEAKNAIVRLACEQLDPGDSERVTGFCIVHLERGRSDIVGYVVTLDVEPAYRRQGIGPKLMHSVEVLARDAGAAAMTLHVWSGNRSAIQLYERLGYVYLRTANDFYGPDFDALVYRKLFSAAGGNVPSDDSGEWNAFEGPSRNA